MSKHITGEQIFDGVFSIARDCIKYKRSPLDQLEYSNGHSAAMFNSIIFENQELYWPCVTQMMDYENIKPASMFYVTGYNDKAAELNTPLYNSFGILVKLVSILIVIGHVNKKFDVGPPG